MSAFLSVFVLAGTIDFIEFRTMVKKAMSDESGGGRASGKKGKKRSLLLWPFYTRSRNSERLPRQARDTNTLRNAQKQRITFSLSVSLCLSRIVSSALAMAMVEHSIAAMGDEIKYKWARGVMVQVRKRTYLFCDAFLYSK
jgi:hypothetical protein